MHPPLSNSCPRVDMFSVSGGVGKTPLAVRLARLQSMTQGKPVLLVDADVIGPCLGDMLESWASPRWRDTPNLLHLICGRPEYLLEHLRPESLPVYRMRDKQPADPKAQEPERVTAALRGKPAVLFCPHHLYSTRLGIELAEDEELRPQMARGMKPLVEPMVVHALLAHESAGGWIGHVIDQVIRATDRLLGWSLGGVIVDHGPALGTLQSVTLRGLLSAPASKPRADAGEREASSVCVTTRRAVIVTTPKAADNASARDLAGWAASQKTDPSALERIVWVVNHATRAKPDWNPLQDLQDGDLWPRVFRVIADNEDPDDTTWDELSAPDDDLKPICSEIFG
jgi:hypothetical protein